MLIDALLGSLLSISRRVCVGLLSNRMILFSFVIRVVSPNSLIHSLTSLCRKELGCQMNMNVESQKFEGSFFFLQSCPFQVWKNPVVHLPWPVPSAVRRIYRKLLSVLIYDYSFDNFPVQSCIKDL